MATITSLKAKEPVFQIAGTVSLFACVLNLVLTFLQITVWHICLNCGGYEIISLSIVQTLCRTKLDKFVFVTLYKVNFDGEEILSHIGHRLWVHRIPFAYRCAESIEFSVFFLDVNRTWIYRIYIRLFARSKSKDSHKES